LPLFGQTEALAQHVDKTSAVLDGTGWLHLEGRGNPALDAWAGDDWHGRELILRNHDPWQDGQRWDLRLGAGGCVCSLLALGWPLTVCLNFVDGYLR